MSSTPSSTITSAARTSPLPASPAATSIAVTGATGFVGRYVCEYLSTDKNIEVTALVRDAKRARLRLPEAVAVKTANLNNRRQMENALTGIDCVVHTAYDFAAGPEESLHAFDVLLKACVAQKVERFVHLSSIAAYDGWPGGTLTERAPISVSGTVYKQVKAQMERALDGHARTGSLPSIILQPTIIYGPHSRFWTDRVLEQLATGTIVLPNDGSGLCPAVHIDDVVRAIHLAVAAPDRVAKTAERFIISGPEPVTWRTFFETYKNFLGTGTIEYVPLAELTSEAPGGAGASPGQSTAPATDTVKKRLARGIRTILGPAAIDHARRIFMKLNALRGPVKYRPSAYDARLFASHGHCAIDKARDILGYAPSVTFEQGCARMADYIETFRPG